jgi:hypothetical protein
VPESSSRAAFVLAIRSPAWAPRDSFPQGLLGSRISSGASKRSRAALGKEEMDKRRSPRFRTRFDALISVGREEGSGALVEISYAGARLEQTSLQPPIGTRITLFVFVAPVAPFELTGHVIRLTENGFAITYELFDPEIQHLVDDVSALVEDPPGHD